MTNPTAPSPGPGDIVFFDDYLPALDAATYTITLSHRVSVDGAHIPDHTRTVEVLAPRFALPSEDVHSVHPPGRASGHYSHELPQIVLGRRMLPWERRVTAEPSTAEARPPWMALLVLEADELPPQAVRDGTVAELLAQTAQIELPNIEPNADEQGLACRTLDLAGDLFVKLAPTLDELPYLAHCRQADTSGKADLQLVEDGWFSVVVANRFPRAPGDDEPTGVRHVVHLVSLEGWDTVLDGKRQLPAGSVVRLVSLADWDFRCLPELAETFSGLAEALMAAATAEGAATYLRLPLKTDDKLLRARLNAGFVPTTYHTAHGEDTLAWYRGPLLPERPDPSARPQSKGAAPAVYVASDGMFDLSHAAAWQLGRMLAVADPSFVEALTTLRLNGRRLLDRMLAYRETGLALPDGLAALAAANPAVDRMYQALTGGLAKHVADAAKASAKPGSAATPALPISPLAGLKALFTDSAATALMAEQVRADARPVADWLARLALLYPLPFDYLVPRPELLPTERLRLFTVDSAWVETLVNGALSLGGGSSLDGLYMAQARPILDKGWKAPFAGNTPMAGVLLRSHLVSAFPGLTLRPFAKTAALPILRVDRLSAGVMLCLFSGLADRIEVCEPREGLRFGVDDHGACVVRALSGGKVGRPIPSPADAELPLTVQVVKPDFSDGACLRSGGLRVLDLATEKGLVGAMKTATGASALGPAQFALQMIQAPERAVVLCTKEEGNTP